MSIDLPTSEALPKLLLPARDAARVLSISERALWSLTQPRGSIPIVKIGSRGVRYAVSALRAFAEGGGNGQSGNGGPKL